MSDVDLFDIFDENEEQDDPQDLKKSQNLLEGRCVKADIEFEVREFIDGEEYVDVKLPNGREKKSIVLYDLERLNNFLSIPFEKYVFLGDYVAICSYETGSIEAMLRSVGPFSSSMIQPRLFGRAYDEEDPESNKSLLFELKPDDA